MKIFKGPAQSWSSAQKDSCPEFVEHPVAELIIRSMKKCGPHKRSRIRKNVRMWEEQGQRCPLCGKRIDIMLMLWRPRNKWAPSIDHIRPLSRGGSNTPENLQLTHKVCNENKGDEWVP